jgi:FAD/FMN-containing dehydrogenase
MPPAADPSDPSDAPSLLDLDDLRARFRGPLLAPSAPRFDEARKGWNGLVDRRPAAIIRCAGVADVIAAVRLAGQEDVPLAVKSGGHDFAGKSTSEGGLLVDLSDMDGVRVDPEGRTVRVEAGARWRDVDHETQAFGLATTGGTVSSVGVAGYVLGGGTGYLSRKHGLALDNLVSADVVTADGRLVTASADQHSDLFWGLRGAGANLGIVTSFELRLHELSTQILAGQIIHAFEDANDVLRFCAEYLPQAPEALQCYPFLLKLPPLEVIPEAYHGKPALDLVVAFAGTPEEGEGGLHELRGVGDPILDGVFPQPYTAVQQTFDLGMPAGVNWYSRAQYLEDLPDAAMDTLLAHCAQIPGPYSSAYLEPAGGAIGRVDPGATAFPHRTAPFGFHVVGGWSDPAEADEVTAWAETLHAAMVPFSTGGVYVNLLGVGEGEDRVRAAYGANWGRLVKVKRAWDPDNLFRGNQNVPPGG